MIFKKGNVGPRKGSTACCLPTVKNPLLKDLASFAHLPAYCTCGVVEVHWEVKWVNYECREKFDDQVSAKRVYNKMKKQRCNVDLLEVITVRRRLS